jgi:hypothetical protein
MSSLLAWSLKANASFGLTIFCISLVIVNGAGREGGGSRRSGI